MYYVLYKEEKNGKVIQSIFIRMPLGRFYSEVFWACPLGVKAQGRVKAQEPLEGFYCIYCVACEGQAPRGAAGKSK